MSQVAISGNASGTGTLTIAAPNTNSNYTLTLPTNTGTLISTKSAGTVLQVLQSTFAGTQAVSGASAWADITSLSVSITPTSSSSKILVSFVVNCDGENNLYFRIMRDSTAIGVGTAAGSRQQVSAGNGYVPSNTSSTTMMTNQFLDSPATSSSITYKIQGYANDSAGSGTYYINYASGDGNNAQSSRCLSSITVMEISA